MHRSRKNKSEFQPEEIIEKVEIEETVIAEPEKKEPVIKDKSILRLTKELILAGQELRQQIEDSRKEREEFKKLLNEAAPKNVEVTEEVIIEKK